MKSPKMELQQFRVHLILILSITDVKYVCQYVKLAMTLASAFLNKHNIEMQVSHLERQFTE